MRVVYHPAVQRDVSAILRYYDGIASRLGDEFWSGSWAALKGLRCILNAPILWIQGGGESTCGDFPTTFFSARRRTASGSRLSVTTNSPPGTGMLRR